MLVSTRFDPYKATDSVMFLFFGSLFMVIWGLMTMLLNRFKLKIDWPDFYKSFRIGFIISLAIFAGYMITIIVV